MTKIDLFKQILNASFWVVEYDGTGYLCKPLLPSKWQKQPIVYGAILRQFSMLIPVLDQLGFFYYFDIINYQFRIYK